MHKKITTTEVDEQNNYQDSIKISVNLSGDIFVLVKSNDVYSYFPISFDINRKGGLIFPRLSTGPQSRHTKS